MTTRDHACSIYLLKKANVFTLSPVRFTTPSITTCLETRQPMFVINENFAERAEELWNYQSPRHRSAQIDVNYATDCGRCSEVALFSLKMLTVKMPLASRMCACSNTRQLYECRARKCPSLRRDPAPAQRNRRTRCGTCHHQQRAGGFGFQTRNAGNL